ncbi:MAG: HAD family hydrolase [Oscillospiraceae bacterium]|nr:HAD family hydrolase [Oscillospiraceae bacterium]
MKVFCWDFDGTIASSKSLWTGSVFDALKTVMPQIEDSFFHEIKAYMQFGFPWHTPDADYTFCKGDKWWEFMEKHFYESYIKCGIAPEVAQTATKMVRPIIKQKSRYTLYNDAADTLRIIKGQGAINVLMSNNYPDLGDILKQFGLSPYFDEVILSAVVGYNKPHREFFDLVKAKYPNAEFYMIGDSINADILGGKRNGMKTVLVHKGFSEYADYCFDELRCVLSLL